MLQIIFNHLLPLPAFTFVPLPSSLLLRVLTPTPPPRLPLSKTYVFHGLRPTMTAGFGQVDLGARMDLQRRFVARLGGVTTRIRFRTDRGGETGLMTRLHLIRIWRDGSIVYVIFFALIGILPASLGPARTGPGGLIAATQTLTFLLGLLA